MMTERQRHMCNGCGNWGEWSQEWSWFGSLRDREQGRPIIKVCSNECRAAVQARLDKAGGVYCFA
jgi:hypothetical protein